MRLISATRETRDGPVAVRVPRLRFWTDFLIIACEAVVGAFAVALLVLVLFAG